MQIMRSSPTINIHFYKPGDFPFGWVGVEVGFTDASAFWNIGTNAKDVTLANINDYRSRLLALERSLSEGIETVRQALEVLPAQSVESAKCPLLIGEVAQL